MVLRKFKAKPGVYKMINTISGNVYIGSSINISRRISNHKKELKKGYKDNIRIRTDLEKYGKESFDFEVLEYCNLEDTKAREQYYFELLKPFYNVWKTIYSAANRTYTPEQLKHLAEICRSKRIKDIELFKKNRRELWAERKKDPNYKEKYLKHFDKTGTKHSPETIELFKKQRKGKPKSEEMKNRLRQARLGTKWDPKNKTWIKGDR